MIDVPDTKVGVTRTPNCQEYTKKIDIIILMGPLATLHYH